MKTLSLNYTLDDHRSRANDRYAQAKYEITKQWIAPHIRPGMTLVNIGCGSGYFNRIAHSMGLHVVAAEPDRSAFELAVEEGAGSPIELYNCDLQGLTERKVTGDFVVFHDVLEHIADDRGAGELLHKIVRPGGRIIVSVPALQWLFGRHDEQLGHYRRYTCSSLKNVLADNFEFSRTRYFGMLSIPIVLMLSKYLRIDYPRSATTNSMSARIYGAACDLETRIAFPLGTSLIAEIQPK